MGFHRHRGQWGRVRRRNLEKNDGCRCGREISVVQGSDTNAGQPMQGEEEREREGREREETKLET